MSNKHVFSAHRIATAFLAVAAALSVAMVKTIHALYAPAPLPATQVVFTQEDLHVRVMNPDGVAGLEFGQWCIAKSGGRIDRLPWVKWAGPTMVVEYVIAGTAGLGECPSHTHFEIAKFDFGTMEGGKKAWEDHLQSVRSGLKVSFEAYISSGH